MQVVVTGSAGSFRRGDQRPQVLDVAQWAIRNCLLNPRQPCALQLSKVELSGLTKQRRDNPRPPQLHSKARGSEQPTAPACRLAEFRGACHRRYRHGDRAALPRPLPGSFEIERDVLVFTGLQRSTVPCTAVGLISQHRRQRLMSAPAVLQRRALRDCGSHQRMPKTKRLQIDLDDPRPDGGRHDVKVEICTDYGAASRQDLTQCV